MVHAVLLLILFRGYQQKLKNRYNIIAYNFKIKFK